MKALSKDGCLMEFNNMQIPVYHVDAFTDKMFYGNPAAVCILPQWLPDNTLHAIAKENNLSVTAFLLREGHSVVW